MLKATQNVRGQVAQALFDDPNGKTTIGGADMLEHPLNDQYDTLLCQSIIQEILLHLLLLLSVYFPSHIACMVTLPINFFEFPHIP